MPKMLEVDVKSKSDVVGVATYPEYVSTEEAVADQGEAKTVEQINAQVRTNAMNVVRNAAVGRPSKKKLLRKARAAITVEEFTSVQGDPDAIDALVEQKARELLDAGEGED